MNAGRYSLRLAAAEDAAQIAEVHRAARQEAYRDFVPAATIANHLGATGTAYWNQRLPEILASDDLLALAETGTRVVGFVHMTGERLHRLYVSPAWWGTGLAQGLFALARDHARSQGLARLTLDCHVGNARARRFYARLGGKERGERDDSFADGTTAPVVDIVWALV